MTSHTSTSRSPGPVGERYRRATTVAVCALVGIGVAQSLSTRHVSVSVQALLALGAFLGSFPLLTLREYAAAGLVSGLSGTGLELLGLTGPSSVALYSSLALIGLRLDQTVSRRLAGVVGVAALAGFARHTSASPGDLASVIAGLTFTYIAGTSLRRLRLEQQRTQDLLHEVVASRDAQIAAAALNERSRLAREMHDVLAHTLAALSVQLEGVRMLAEQKPGDPATTAAIERAGKLAREGLEEARRAVGALRGDSLPGPEMLDTLAEDFQRDTGTPTTVQVRGDPVELAPDARLALYRAAQEALTNVRKHADATNVAITLAYQQDGTELVVEDRGRSKVSALSGGGYGLHGMRERAELLGGSLAADPTEAGFRVRLWMPR